MAGHVEDRWYRDKIDPETGNPVLTTKGKPVRERSDLYGTGLRYRVRYYNDEKKERSKSFPDRDLKKAQDFLTKMQHDVLAGVFVDPDAGDMLFKAFTENWRKGQSQDAATRQTVDRRLNSQIYPFLGSKPLKVVERPDTIRDWLHWMRSERPDRRKTGAAYHAQMFDLVSAVLQAAKEERRIRTNPCRLKSIKKPKPEQRKVVPWPETTVHALHSALPERYRIVVPLGSGAALRQMEILAVSADDIDRDGLELNVVRQIRWIGNTPVFAPPKHGKTRVVPLSEGVLEQIDRYRRDHEPRPLTLPWRDPGGKPVTVNLLIDYRHDMTRLGRPHTRTRPWRGGNFDASIWTPAFAEAGLVYGGRTDGMHAMRHFCASHWLAHGVSIKEVAEYLGHRDPGYTLRIYTHLVRSSHARARAAIDGVFTPEESTKDEQKSTMDTNPDGAGDDTDHDTED